MIYNKNKRCNILELTHNNMVIRSFASSTTAVSYSLRSCFALLHRQLPQT